MITFDPHLNVPTTEVIVVGLGGTGSALSRHVARTVYHMKHLGIQTPASIKFVDPDIVEEKNVGRQLFSFSDAGQHKAEILARRFNAVLGLGIQFFNEPFSVEKHCEDNRYHNESRVILGCVDNHLARRELAKAKGVWIDSGNHANAGQVVMGTTSNPNLINDQLKAKPLAKSVSLQAFSEHGTRAEGEPIESWKHLPNAALLYPALLEPEPEPVRTNIINLSCADMIALGEQHLLVNDAMAGIAGNYFYKLMFRQKIETFITNYDGDLLSMRSIRISREEIEARMPQAV
jgi:PRTRC genetic system ThiF family protein